MKKCECGFGGYMVGMMLQEEGGRVRQKTLSPS